MKFCSHCGKEVNEDAVVCINCGCEISSKKGNTNSNSLKDIAKIFMIISAVLYAWCLIPLIWCIPMITSLSNKMRTGEKVTTSFKVCTLLFVSLIAGILLLCDKEE